MAFGLCTSAFAETATPETAQSTAEAVEPQTVDGLDDATDDQVDSAATVYVVRQAEGMVLTLFEQSYENFQEALNAVETAQVDTSYDGDEDVYYLASIVLDKNITGAFTVPAYTGNTGSLPTLYFNGHFITAENGPALTMDKGSKLYISDDDYTGYIYGGNYPAIRIADTSESSIWIHGGAYMADSQLPISMDSDLQGLVQVQEGKFSHELPAYMICPNTADTIYRQHFDGGLYTVKGYPPVNGNAVAQDDDGNAYTTLQEAINVSKSDITLLADITESVEIGVHANVTIDFNGHTMTASDEYYAINSDGQLKLLDSSADQKGGTRSEILNKGMMQVYSGTYSVTTGNVFDNSGTATLWGGKYYGAPNQAVFLCYEGSDNPNMMSTGITFVDIEAYAGEGGTILGRQPGSTCFYVFAQQGSLGGGYFYGDLGMSEPEMVQLFGGHFDREPSADCVYTADNKAREIIKEGKFWRVTEKVNDPVATVTGEDGTNIPFASLNDAVNRAAKLEAEKNDYYTVTLNKDVTTNVLTSFVTNKTVTIDLNGHILTAQDANKAAISAAGTKIFLRGSEGTINGRIESDTYLWIIHTTVNALNGQPAIVNTSADNNQLSVKGTSVINGTAGQAVIVSNGCTVIGDESVLGNDKLNGSNVVLRLPIPAEVTEMYAVVTHAGDPDRYYTIQTGEDGKKYIEVSTTYFSVFTVNFTNTLPAFDDTAEETTPAQTAPTQTAPKQDDSAYYTCKACGYHDWTAIDGGYKCDHCGYVESVKQIAGYPNVKGKAEVGKTAAVKAQAAAKTMSAIPQTSDDMPVTALAVIALAALLGLGVTVVMKRKHE